MYSGPLLPPVKEGNLPLLLVWLRLAPALLPRGLRSSIGESRRLDLRRGPPGGLQPRARMSLSNGFAIGLLLGPWP